MSSSAEARFRIAASPPTGRIIRVVSLERVSASELTEVASADIVVMVTVAGADAGAAAAVGQICSRHRVTTATIVVRGPSTTDQALSKTLAQVRPWSLMVVVAGDESYLDDLIASFR